MISQFKPPYDESFQVPDPTVAQVLVQHNTTHTYVTPGECGSLPCQCPVLGITPLKQAWVDGPGPYQGEGGVSWDEGWTRPLNTVIVCWSEATLLSPLLSLFVRDKGDYFLVTFKIPEA